MFIHLYMYHAYAVFCEHIIHIILCIIGIVGMTLFDNLLAHNITETNQSYDLVYINKCLFQFDLHQHIFPFYFQ